MAFYFFVTYVLSPNTCCIDLDEKENGRMIVHSIIFQFGRAVKLLKTRS